MPLATRCSPVWPTAKWTRTPPAYSAARLLPTFRRPVFRQVRARPFLSIFPHPCSTNRNFPARWAFAPRKLGLVAQLDRAIGFEPIGRGFESLRVYVFTYEKRQTLKSRLSRLPMRLPIRAGNTCALVLGFNVAPKKSRPPSYLAGLAHVTRAKCFPDPPERWRGSRSRPRGFQRPQCFRERPPPASGGQPRWWRLGLSHYRPAPVHFDRDVLALSSCRLFRGRIPLAGDSPRLPPLVPRIPSR